MNGKKIWFFLGFYIATDIERTNMITLKNWEKKNPRGTCIPSGFWMKKSCIYVHVCPVIDCRITRMYFISVILILTNLQKSPKLAKTISQKLVIRHIWKIFKNFLKNCNVTDERCGPWTSCYTCIIKPMVICIRFQKICLK